ncbi:unnamed protein product [Triticum turgidum subsp. durum]|uniref:Dof-type domain-containing protein n=1 Tax=Triticum turgidum subsp. durum TaxID=4567 RepID=A0A9R1S6I9_TRITD|nr:unnamed protein product [Triticum turgidum subsp. durum]
MRKEGCAEVNHYNKSASQRSQVSQSTRFRLVIENNVSRTIYKKETVEIEDGGGHIKVAMYDGVNRIAHDHLLASAKVDLVVIEGCFNEPKRDSWSKEEFEESIIKPRKGITRLVKNGTFDLTDGCCDHEGAIIMDNSQQREVKLGVMIAVPTGVRVLEGVSNPFKVQEGKTKKPGSNKKGKKPSPVPMRNLAQTTSTHTTQHGQSPVTPDEQHSHPPPAIQDVLQKSECGKHTEFLTDDTAVDNRVSYPPAIVPQMVEGNGQALNCNGQQFSQQIPVQILWQPTNAHSMQNGQDYSLPQTSIQNPSQAAGYCPVYQPLLAREQDQYTSFFDASCQLAFPNLSAYTALNDIHQWTSIPEGEISVDDVHNLIVPTQIQDTYGSFRCGQVLLQWDKPHVEPKEHWNFLDELMPLHSTQSRFYGESFPSTSLMDKVHKLLASTSSGDSVLKMITGVMSRAMQTPQRRGVLIRAIEPYDSDDKPPVKKQRNAKYQLRFVNRVRNDYYTQEQIKSEDGNLLKVALYDENNLVVTSGPLSSASVEVVLLHGDFNADGQDYWTSQEFSACLVHSQSVEEPPALGGDRVLALTHGEADVGNVSFQISSFHARTGKFKMGVEIKNVREESVQQGITSPFLVRVRQGEESSHHRITSPEALLRVRMELPKQVCGALQCDATENVCESSDQSSPERNVLVASKVDDHDSIVQSGSGVLLFPAPPPSPEQARVPQPEPGLNCPRCDSTNTEFFFFNNHSVTQPRNFCGECRLGLGAALDIADRAAGAPAAAAYVAAASGTSTSTKPSTTATASATSAPMSMVERARLAKVPQPEPGLKCPRCDSTNTKFCYFNNYSLTQPRHFCRACRRYWTRGGAVRNVPVGGGYRRSAKSKASRNVPVGGGYSCHAKRSAKSKASDGEPAAATGTASCALTAPKPDTPSCTGTAPPGLHHYSMFCTKSESPHSNRFADNFDLASFRLGSLFADGGVHHQPVLQGMFDLGLQRGGGNCKDGASSTTT